MQKDRALAWGIGLFAVVCHLLAAVCVVLWLGRTDWLFGHFQGPASLLVAALVWAGLGIAATVAYFSRLARINWGLGCALIALALLSVLLALGALAELFPPRAAPGPPQAYPKPTDPVRPH